VIKVKHMNLYSLKKSTFIIYKKATNDLHINENNYHKSIVGTTTIMSFDTAGNITLTTYEKNSKKHVECKWLSEFHSKHEKQPIHGH
jgi:hypothetical protein